MLVEQHRSRPSTNAELVSDCARDPLRCLFFRSHTYDKETSTNVGRTTPKNKTSTMLAQYPLLDGSTCIKGSLLRWEPGNHGVRLRSSTRVSITYPCSTTDFSQTDSEDVHTINSKDVVSVPFVNLGANLLHTKTNDVTKGKQKPRLLFTVQSIRAKVPVFGTTPSAFIALCVPYNAPGLVVLHGNEHKTHSFPMQELFDLENVNIFPKTGDVLTIKRFEGTLEHVLILEALTATTFTALIRCLHSPETLAAESTSPDSQDQIPSPGKISEFVFDSKEFIWNKTVFEVSVHLSLTKILFSHIHSPFSIRKRVSVVCAKRMRMRSKAQSVPNSNILESQAFGTSKITETLSMKIL